MDASQDFRGRFTRALLETLYQRFLDHLPPEHEQSKPTCLIFTVADQRWTVDELDNFLAEIDTASNFVFEHSTGGNWLKIEHDSHQGRTRLRVSLPDRNQIRSLLELAVREHVEPNTEVPHMRNYLGKTKFYYRTVFPPATIRRAYDVFKERLADSQSSDTLILTIARGSERWSLASLDDFFTEIHGAVWYRLQHGSVPERFWVVQEDRSTSVDVYLPCRSDVQAVFGEFERDADAGKIKTEAEPAKIFIGHGRNPQWRDLKDHLHDHHGLEVIHYEIGPRAGLSVKEVLEGMLNKSSFALLVLTGEDLHDDGELHARENVIHELGLFQGRIGFTRALALLENGVKEFSNILGVNQTRFPQGHIRETFGDVLATIKRELSDDKT
ncbi:MAG: nucleotide-binding protein [Desulfomonile tiedjei]|nr:nucleotide-binding protein [Desulfomonile tiedjei]